MDLALTQSIIKASHQQHTLHQNLNRTNSQQVISTSQSPYHSQPPHQTHSLTQISSEANTSTATLKLKNDSSLNQDQQQLNRPTRKFHFGASKTMVNLLRPTHENEEEIDAITDSDKLKEHVHEVIKTINEHLNLTQNGTTLDHKKPDKVTIYVCIVFLKIGEIDTVKERFQADAYIESYWEDDKVDSNIAFDPRADWNPELHIENAIGELKQEIRYKVERTHNNKTRVYEIRNIKGIFWERLELWDFPLDVQELSITLSTSRSENEIDFEVNPTNPCTVNTQDFLNQQEWNIFTHVNTAKKTINDLWNNYKRPCFSSTSFVSRKPGYFIYNAYMLIFFVSTLGFVPFSFAVVNNHLRIQVTSLLILTSVNFRWIVTQRLPTVSYLTTLDKYAIGALIFLVALCGWHATIGSSLIYDGDITNKDRVDSIVLIIIGVLYLIYHVVYFTFFYLKYRKYDKIGMQADHDEPQSNAITMNNSNNSISNKNGTPTAGGTPSSTLLKRKKSTRSKNIESIEESLSAAVNFTLYNNNDLKTIQESNNELHATTVTILNSKERI